MRERKAPPTPLVDVPAGAGISRSSRGRLLHLRREKPTAQLVGESRLGEMAEFSLRPPGSGQTYRSADQTSRLTWNILYRHGCSAAILPGHFLAPTRATTTGNLPHPAAPRIQDG
ncbi:hypothetical protein J2X98_003772 [Pseudarthrobacter enclensis]|uniref:Uncharacterized protein n=1 Tax=Pseudarthrobacter enclensis TaxID=993070 RepID=A0ABT9RY31_9MICC|nr:hypothetical protein [Pseudarthrobacter enclensis]